jgi:hypothetical protein
MDIRPSLRHYFLNDFRRPEAAVSALIRRHDQSQNLKAMAYIIFLKHLKAGTVEGLPLLRQCHNDILHI